MLRQEIDIDGWWLVTVIYLPQERDMERVAGALEAIGCPGKTIDEAVRLLRDERNKGVTFSNPYRRRSVTVIGRSTSWEEFFDTLLHEVGHVRDDIVFAYDVMNYGEPPAYLQGYIGKQMAPMVRRIACPCCGAEKW